MNFFLYCVFVPYKTRRPMLPKASYYCQTLLRWPSPSAALVFLRKTRGRGWQSPETPVKTFVFWFGAEPQSASPEGKMTPPGFGGRNWVWHEKMIYSLFWTFSTVCDSADNQRSLFYLRRKPAHTAFKTRLSFRRTAAPSGPSSGSRWR